MRHRALLLLLAALTLSGCWQERPSPESRPTPQETLPDSPPPPKPPPPQPAPVPVPAPKPVPVPMTKTLESPEELIGQDREGLVVLLGEPAEDRSEHAARILTWRNGKSCNLEAFLFFDVTTGVERVLSYEMTPSSGQYAVNCYKALRKHK